MKPQHFLIAFSFVFVVSVYNLYSLDMSYNRLSSKVAEFKSYSKTPNFDVLVFDAECPDCLDFNQIVSALQRAGNVSVQRYSSEDSKTQSFINASIITKLPAVVVLTDSNNINLSGFEKKGKYYVLSADVPYVDAKTLNKIGFVKAIQVLSKDCNVCDDFNSWISGLADSGVKIDSFKTVFTSDNEFVSLRNDFDITRVPVLLISDDFNAYPLSRNVNSNYINGYYVFDGVVPYFDLNTSKVRGLVDLTYIYDSNCDNCYDPKIHKSILSNFRVRIKSESSVDIQSAEGQLLIQKYNLTSWPTVIISGDINLYSNINAIWPQVGTIEQDGNYVFRKNEIFGDLNYVVISNG